MIGPLTSSVGSYRGSPVVALAGNGSSSYWQLQATAAQSNAPNGLTMALLCYPGGSTNTEPFSNSSSASTVASDILVGPVSTAGAVGFRVATGVVTDTAAGSGFNDGKWHLIVGRYDLATVSLYVDGDLQQSVAYAPGGITATQPLSIEKRGTNFFSVPIALAGYWTRPLTHTEVISLSANPWQVFQPARRRVYSVSAAAPTITISPTSLPGGTVGVPYSETISASGGTAPYSFVVTSGSLPPGLTLSASGLLSGTPTRAASYSFTIQATDVNGYSGTQPYSGVTVSAPTIAITPSSIAGGMTLIPINATLLASGGISPYTFTVSSGALPPGMSLSPGGIVSGPPIAAGKFAFTVEATDSSGYTGTQSYRLTIVAPPVVSVGAPTQRAPSTQQTLPVQPVASQTFPVTLGNQNCTITLQQMSTGLFFTLAVAGNVIVSSRYCADRVNLVRPAYLGFSGYLYFVDTSGAGEDPSYKGLGSQFILVYEQG